MIETKLKRGQKLCSNCNTINGVRSFNCKSCNHPFSMKKKRVGFPVNRFRKKLVEDFTTLNKGDKIKVIGRSGPYHTDNDGNKHYLANRGKFTVDSIMKNGIMAYSEFGTNEFIYMGPDETSPILNSLTRSAHKVILIKKAEIDG